jgi:hypothetical protein
VDIGGEERKRHEFHRELSTDAVASRSRKPRGCSRRHRRRIGVETAACCSEVGEDVTALLRNAGEGREHHRDTRLYVNE